jgi:dienelactone hydrolase
VQLGVSPQRAPVDEPVTIQLDGLTPGSRVTVRATLHGYVRPSGSSATFVADDHGCVDLSRDAPVAGSYEGVDSMGLFWSMRQIPDAAGAFSPHGPLTVELTADVEGHVVASATVERLIVADDIVATRVRERGLVGALFRPASPGPYPPVMVMGGSGGGLGVSYWQAAVLARHGFAALAVAYFAMESLPERLVNIPLEYFETALAWLAAQPAVADGRAGVIGTSRGGELVLLLGAAFPERVGAVVAYVPSHVVWGGLGGGVAGPVPSWTHQGQPVPTMRRWRRPPTEPAPPEHSPDMPLALTPGFLKSLEDQEQEARTAIPVERIDGPVLLISGREDAMWPSSLMADRVAERLATHRHPYAVEHLAYDGAGHTIWIPNLPASTSGFHPVEKRLYDYGGTLRGTAHASAASWPRVIHFLRANLGGVGPSFD